MTRREIDRAGKLIPEEADAAAIDQRIDTARSEALAARIQVTVAQADLEMIAALRSQMRAASLQLLSPDANPDDQSRDYFAFVIGAYLALTGRSLG